MGKKRIIKKGESRSSESATTAALKKKIKRGATNGFVYITSTYNNTIITCTDEKGGVLFWGSAGSMGFSGAKKGTPYAASKVAGVLCERGRTIGLKEVGVFIRGVGAGRESAIRSLANGGLTITTIKDITPIPHNGPKLPKVRRV